MTYIEDVRALFDTVQSVNINPNLVEIPQDRSMGDFALPCFSFAKELKKAPQQIAKDIAAELGSIVDPHPDPLSTATLGEGAFLKCVSTIEAVGPYVNVTLKTAYVAEEVIKNVLEQGAQYGAGVDKCQTILVEGRSPNTHKMLHVGHLRNALTSETICTISEFAGYTVIRSAYGGDIGAHVAKRIWYFTNFTDGLYPSEVEAFTIWSGDLYQQATSKINEDKEKSEEYKTQVHEVQRLLESGDKKLTAIWQETREMSIAGLKSAFTELGCTIQKFYRESDVEQPGIELVKQYLDDESITNIRMSEGAIISDLEEFDLGVFLLLKSNGTCLYSTKDIALAYLKESDYEFHRSLYVVATEQNHHFQQLFKTLELVGYDTSKLHHMGYELVELPDGKMSSRKGTIIPYHTWRDNAIQQAQDLIADRDIQNKDDIARVVAFSALKFSMLLQDTYKKIRLDMGTALSFEGETGPYLQYTHARCCSIQRNAKNLNLQASSIDYSCLVQDSERLLLLHLSEFGDVVTKAADEYKPSLVARYVLELARMFNGYYQSTKILLEDDEPTTQARLALVASVQQVLKNGLRLLGIEAPEKM